MTRKDRSHTNRVLRVFTTAVKQLEKLANQAIENKTYPLTTQKALIEVVEAQNKARLRVVAENASVI